MRRYIEAALDRRRTTDEAKRFLANFNGEQKDWYGTCRKCQQALRGAIAVLQSHECEKGGI